MKLKFLRYYTTIALSASLLSTCPRAAVGAIVVSTKGRTVGTGYNGSPKGTPHCDEVGCVVDKHGSCIRSTHAEINALLGVSAEDLQDAALFCTHQPCLNCTKAILNSGVSHVYYVKSYSGGELHDELRQQLITMSTVVFEQVKEVLNGSDC